MGLISSGARSVRHVGGALLGVAVFTSGCALWRPAERSLVVSATAYNSLGSQTDGNPSIGAWGDRLRPGMRAIAVSQDLIALGLTRGATVWIDGLPGSYVVLDKMARRWRKRIDIYMGVDVRAAERWGLRQVRIHWRPIYD
jgi:3D (Asp-Asp-Asp) domain-containing protein